MENISIYHNPRWSKSRESVKILEHLGKKFEIIDYIKYPPSSTVLKELANKMGIKGKEFIRKRESVFKELNLNEHLENDDILFKYMSENPKLIERPIIVRENRAILGRPPSKIEELLK